MKRFILFLMLFIPILSIQAEPPDTAKEIVLEFGTPQIVSIEYAIIVEISANSIGLQAERVSNSVDNILDTKEITSNFAENLENNGETIESYIYSNEGKFLNNKNSLTTVNFRTEFDYSKSNKLLI